ncbi:MAG: hypothetical protein ACWGN7_03815 [Thermodesulfovibrionales bacterium]
MKNQHTSECPTCSSLAAPAEVDAHRLSHWPIQIRLIGTVAPFLRDADLLVAADCTAFAAPEGYREMFPGRRVLIGCPKLDDAMSYVEKFTEIFTNVPIQRITCLRMEVPCCGGMTAIVKEAIRRSEKGIPFQEVVVGVKGDLRGDTAPRTDESG